MGAPLAAATASKNDSRRDYNIVAAAAGDGRC